jgi:hypothetical protein
LKGDSVKEFFTNAYLIVMAGLLEFRRCGVDLVRLDLLWNCFYEGTQKIREDEVLSAYWKDDWFYRSDQGDEGLEYWIPAIGEDIYFQFRVRTCDFPHLGLVHKEAISLTEIQLITIQQDRVFAEPQLSLTHFDHPFYKALCSTIQAHAKEEGVLLQAYRRDMIEAEKEVLKKYRKK